MYNPLQKKTTTHFILEFTLFSWTCYLLVWDVQSSLLATLFLCCHRDRMLPIALAPLCYYLRSLLPLLLWTKHGPGGLLLMDLLMYTTFDVPHKDYSFYKTGWPLTFKKLVFFFSCVTWHVSLLSSLAPFWIFSLLPLCGFYLPWLSWSVYDLGILFS